MDTYRSVPELSLSSLPPNRCDPGTPSAPSSVVPSNRSYLGLATLPSALAALLMTALPHKTMPPHWPEVLNGTSLGLFTSSPSNVKIIGRSTVPTACSLAPRVTHKPATRL